MSQLNWGNNDVLINGTFYGVGLSLTTPTITDAMIAASTGIQASKLDHKYIATYAQPNTTATTERKVIHAAHKAGTILQFRAASVVACVGAATVSIRLRKNGTIIDTGALVLDNANTAFVFENVGGFTSTAVAANDVFEIDATAAAGGGTLATGLMIQLILEEDY